MNESHSAGADAPRDFWATRPVRQRQGRKIAGVAAGIGTRYSIDPVLVRVLLVVLAFFGGSGIVLYLLGWLLFPKEGDPGAEQPNHRAPTTAVLVLIVLLFIPVLLSTMRGSGLFGLVLGIGAFCLLHRHRSTPPVPLAGNVPPHSGESGSSSTVYSNSSQERDRSRKWIAIAVIVAAFATAIAFAVDDSTTMTLAIALGVLALGLVVGSLLRRDRMLLIFAVPVGLAAMLLGMHAEQAPSTSHTRSGGSPSISAHPSTKADLKPEYRTNSGDVQLDLRSLHDNVGTRVDTISGRIKVLVPRDANVQARCSGGTGDVKCLGKYPASDRSVQVTDDGPDGPGGNSLHFAVSSRTGDVEVIRG